MGFKREKGAGTVLSIPIEDENGPVWPDKFPQKELDTKLETLKELRYAQEYLVTPVSIYGATLPLEWLTIYDHDRAVEDDVFAEGEYFFGVDPSITGEGDYMSIAVLWRSKKGGMYLVDFTREKSKLDRMIELLERTALIYPPSIINVEANAAQQLFVQELIKRTALPVRMYHPKGKKEDRIAVMANIYFSTARVLVRGMRDLERGLGFDRRMQAFVGEWLGFPRGRYDDTLDSIESALDCASSSGQAISRSSEVDAEDPAEHWRQRRRNWL